ncbi:MAG: hypothetical protein IKB43_06045 [Fibrobacter sp.]|nr:hypothetical protein [Fibrobacter sp.]
MQEPFQNIPSQNTEFRDPKSTIFSRFSGKLEKKAQGKWPWALKKGV